MVCNGIYKCGLHSWLTWFSSGLPGLVLMSTVGLLSGA